MSRNAGSLPMSGVRTSGSVSRRPPGHGRFGDCGCYMRLPLIRSANRNRRLLVGVLLCAAVGLQCQHDGPRDTLAGVDEIPIEMAQLSGAAADPADEMERLAREDPLAFFQACQIGRAHV